MNLRKIRAVSALLLAVVLLFATACSGGQKQSFAEAHDAFETTLARQENDTDPIPEPPEGVFDLVKYSSKVGDLSAYVSSDPGDGQKHPMIIWVVGGWGNGIDDFPWCYPEWDNDQTGSAFWQAGVLTMYPSFRGGSGNPGHYEALFGEVDDIVSAYQYAASLPYVDPDRIYLGGHSTGGTRALLASEYTDVFRAVFCFGAVDEVKYHNNSQFTFDTSSDEEFKMRSPIHWLEDVKKPTFLIEGSEGNSANLLNMEKATKNENLSFFVAEGADHFSVLAPVTRLLAQKVLADTGAECNITLTQAEIDTAMAMAPETPLPVMVPYTIEGDNSVSFKLPYLWDEQDSTQDETSVDLGFYSRYDDDNPWDMSVLYAHLYPEVELGDGMTVEDLIAVMEQIGYTASETTVDGKPAWICTGIDTTESGNTFDSSILFVKNGDMVLEMDYSLHTDFDGAGEPIFNAIVESIAFHN